MYGYAGAATTASQLTSFTTPPATTNDSGQATQSAAAANSAADSTTTSLEAFLTELNTELTQFGHPAHELFNPNSPPSRRS